MTTKHLEDDLADISMTDAEYIAQLQDVVDGQDTRIAVLLAASKEVRSRLDALVPIELADLAIAILDAAIALATNSCPAEGAQP